MWRCGMQRERWLQREFLSPLFLILIVIELDEKFGTNERLRNLSNLIQLF